MSTLTPDECFALYPPGAEAVIALIRHRLENPAEGGHQHHLLVIHRRRFGLMGLWSRLLGREVTEEAIPVVSVTAPEHYRIHAELARCYQAAGSRGRFAAHGMAANFLAQFADMSEEEYKEHHELFKAAARVRSDSPEWKTNHGAALKALHADPLWLANVKAANQAKARTPEWKANHKAALLSVTRTPEWKAKHKAAQEKLWAENPDHREKMKAAAQARAKDPAWLAATTDAARRKAQDPEWKTRQKAGASANAQKPEYLAKLKAAGERRSRSPEWQAKHKATMQVLHSDPAYRAKINQARALIQSQPEWLAKTTAAQQARFPDVTVTFPDGHEETFAGQCDAARAVGRSGSSVLRYLRGERTPSGKLQGFAFRYAA